MADFLLILVFLMVSAGFVWIALWIGKFVRPRVKDSEKESTYECGERPFNKAWFNYNPRFYIVALIFIVFDVAIVLMIPPIVMMRSLLGQASWATAFTGIAVFFTLLAVPLAYVWIRGDLEWITKQDRQS